MLPPVSFSAKSHLGLNSMFLLTLADTSQYHVVDTVPLQTAP